MAINSKWLPTASSGSLLLTASCNELSYDISTNTSKVQCSIQIQNPNNYTMYSGYSQPYIKLTVHTTSDTPGWASWDAQTKYIPNTPAHFDDSIYIEYNVPHKADGSLQCSVTASFYANGVSAGYIPSDNYVNSGTVVCTNIPRASKVDSYTFGVTWDTFYSIKYTKQIASYTQQLRISIPGATEIHRVKNYESGTKVTLPSSAINLLWAAAADRNDVPVEMVLETYNGNVKIGESPAYTKTFEVNDPLTITYSIEEIALKSRGVKDNEFVTLLGSKRIKVTATCAHSQPKIFVECGGASKDESNASSGTQYAFDFTNLTNAKYKVYATNQRPNSTVVAIDTTGVLINYFKPSIVYSEVTRTNATASNGFVKLQALVYDGNIGTSSGKNVRYTVLKNGSAIINESATANNNRMIVDKPISTIPYKDNFKFEFQVTDAFGNTSNVASFYLSNTKPVINYGKKQLDVHHILRLGDDTETGVLALTKDNGIKYGKLMLDNSNYPKGQNFFKIAEFKYVKGISYECTIKVFSGWGFEEVHLRLNDDGSKLVHDANTSYYFGGYRYGMQVLQMNHKGIELWYHINGGNPTLCNITLEYFQKDTTGSYAYNNIKVLGEFQFAKIADTTPIGNTPGAVYTTALNNKLLMTIPVGTLLYNDSSSFNPIHLFGGSWHKISNVGWRRDS